MAATCVCYHLRRAARAVTQRYDARLSEIGLRATQLTALTAVYNRGREISLSALADVMGIEQSALSRNLALLRRRRLIRALPADDGREVRFELTASGRAAIARAFPIWREAQKELEAASAELPLRQLLQTVRSVGDASPPIRRSRSRPARAG
jgi:DNA-binding MarR family transcriptional regulator